MKQLSTLILSLFCAFLASGQSSGHLLQLKGGQEISGDRLLYERPILKDPYFSLDGAVYPTDTVEFFKNNHGYFANLGDLSNGKQRYALRIQSGKISLYEEVDMAIYGDDVIDVEMDPGTSTSPLLAGGEAMEFYVKEGQAVKKATYKNLKLDLSGNEESMKHLKDFQKFRLFQWGTFGLGIGTTVASLFLNDNNRAEFSPLTALGVAISGSAYFFEYPKRDALLIAVDEYNKD